jgi:hypothetical protein
MEDADAGHRSATVDCQGERPPELVGPRLDELAVKLGQLPCALDWMNDAAERNRPVHRVQAKTERGGDAEVRAGAAKSPEQIRVFVLARPDEAAVGGHEVDREQVVDREAELPLQPSHSPAERQPGDTV